MGTHDPQKVVEDLRNQLATHDRPLAFLFGAGTSSSVDIAPSAKPGQKRKHKPLVPSTPILTELCKKAVCKLGKEFEAVWAKLASQCSESKEPANVENILSLVGRRVDTMASKEESLGLTREQMKHLETAIRNAVASAVMPSEGSIPDSLPHDDFARWVRNATRSGPVEVFTTNYDILLERALEIAGVPVFDGFVGAYEPFFDPDVFEHEEVLPHPRWLRLWKIHGSVNWQLRENRSKRRVVRTLPSKSGEMILPSHLKYDESRKQPYTALLARLRAVVDQDHALLLTCGYSYSDEHINAEILDSLSNRPSAHVVALKYGDLAPTDPLANWAEERQNLMAVARNAAVIGGRYGEWRLQRAVDVRTSSFMDIAFDSDAAPPLDGKETESGSAELAGRMRLGDFIWFCRFLGNMVTGDHP